MILTKNRRYLVRGALVMGISIFLASSAGANRNAEQHHQQGPSPQTSEGKSRWMNQAKMRRAKVRVLSWAARLLNRNNTSRDPWKAKLTGYGRGAKVKLEKQEKSKPIRFPLTADAPKAKGTKRAARQKNRSEVSKEKARKARNARKRFSRMWRKAFHKAESWSLLRELEVGVDDASQEYETEEIEEELPVHTSIRARGRDANNRKYNTAYTNVEGLPLENVQDDGRTYQRSGMFEPTAKMWVQLRNLLVTAPVDGKARLLGLAAFMRGATVTITNVHRNVTKTFVAGSYKGREEKGHSGGDFVELEAEPGERLKIHVSFPPVQNAANGCEITKYVEAPADRGIPVINKPKRNRRYFRPREQPAEVAHDLSKLYITPALRKGDKDPGKAVLFGLEDVLGPAFSRGATVTVTNMRLQAEGKEEAVTQIVTSKQKQTWLWALGKRGIAIEMPAAAFNDRLKIEVSYPFENDKQSRQSFFIEVPHLKGKKDYRPAFITKYDGLKMPFFPVKVVE